MFNFHDKIYIFFQCILFSLKLEHLISSRTRIFRINCTQNFVGHFQKLLLSKNDRFIYQKHLFHHTENMCKIHCKSKMVEICDWSIWHGIRHMFCRKLEKLYTNFGAQIAVALNAQPFSKTQLGVMGSIPTGRWSFRDRNFLDLPGHRISLYLPYDIQMHKWSFDKVGSKLITVEVFIITLIWKAGFVPFGT